MQLGTPERGDIITFYPPHTDKQYVKRVIGLPGDTVRIKGVDIYLNGKMLPVKVSSQNNGKLLAFEMLGNIQHSIQLTEQGILPVLSGELTIPQGKYFVLGDHRNNSVDSRFWGFVDEHNIMGKVTHIAVSFSKQRPLLSRVAVKTL